jgi:hypothetical protein
MFGHQLRMPIQIVLARLTSLVSNQILSYTALIQEEEEEAAPAATYLMTTALHPIIYNIKTFHSSYRTGEHAITCKQSGFRCLKAFLFATTADSFPQAIVLGLRRRVGCSAIARLCEPSYADRSSPLPRYCLLSLSLYEA